MLRVFSELMTPARALGLRSCVRPMSKAAAAPKPEEREFKIDLNVSKFRPEELRVTVEDDLIIIDGSHEERSNRGFISKQFTRMYKVPNGVDVKSLVSSLTSDGILSLKAPIKVVEPTIHEIPITHINHGEEAKKDSSSQPEEAKKA